MDKERLLYAIMLSELPRVGERTAVMILSRCQTRGHGLGTFFRLPPAVLRRDYALPEAALRCLDVHSEAHRRRCEWLATQLAAHGGQGWTLIDPSYPLRLRRAFLPPPPVLFGLGAPSCLAAPTLAVLHSRVPLEDTVAAISRVVECAAANGFTLVTSTGKASYRLVGLASRALAAPHVVVLDRGLFAALGDDLHRDPYMHADRELPERGNAPCILSPFRLLDHALARNGPRRDVLVAAAADVILALHARPGGEIERVCLAALDAGRVVLSWHGENAALVAAGAIPVGEADLRTLSRFAPPQ